jgi:HSP20 family molecular chaperone IbpA
VTHRRQKAAWGSNNRGMHLMIDDNFDEMVRHMFERFFNETFGRNSNTAGIIRFGFLPPKVEEEPNIDLDKGKNILVEKIDLGDSLLLILDGYSSIDDINVEVIEKTIVVNNGLDKEYIDIPNLVDVETSGYSFRNGILEIRLVKIDSENPSRAIITGLLKIES